MGGVRAAGGGWGGLSGCSLTFIYRITVLERVSWVGGGGGYGEVAVVFAGLWDWEAVEDVLLDVVADALVLGGVHPPAGLVG